VIALALLGGASLLHAQEPTSDAPASDAPTGPPRDEVSPDWPCLDPDLPVAQRVADMLGRMTLEEKAWQLEMAPPGIPRLGIPPNYNWWSEGIHGVGRAGEATVFPAAIAMGATWDPALIERVASTIADEARAKHHHSDGGRYRGLTYWFPTVNLVRDPRWGRIEETYSEDPALTTAMGLAVVRGLQGDHPKYLKIAATPKHFAVHSQETLRFKSIHHVSERQLREYYLPAFRACFVEGGAVSVMSAFNGVNGRPCTANRWLLTELLREQWGFEGAVVTDWGAPRLLRRGYGLVETDAEAAALSLIAGVDVLCEHKPIAPHVLRALEDGLIDEAVIDQAVARNLTVRMRLGLFDPPQRVPFAQVPPETIGKPEHVELARELCERSVVLLKNEPAEGVTGDRPLLPLDGRMLRSVAVVGPYAENFLFGAYSGKPANPPIGLVEGLRERLDPRVLLHHVPWKRKARGQEKQRIIEDSLEAAFEADVAIVVVGLSRRIEREGSDRQDMDLPRDEQEFVQRVLAANPATVVVLQNGSPVTINWIDEHAPAILEAWYPGEQGGRAIARVLLGDVSPAARLPVTFYKSLDQLPPIDDYDITNDRTYMYLPDEPLYPFGHGLTYTRFDYTRLRITPDRLALSEMTPVREDGEPVATVTFDLANVGPRDSDEVAQLYLRDVESSLTQPRKKLIAFKRLPVSAGQTRPVTLPITPRDLAYWDEDADGWRIEPGTFELQVGASSADIRLRGELTVE
jgi:beta-glucosidase